MAGLRNRRSSTPNFSVFCGASAPAVRCGASLPHAPLSVCGLAFSGIVCIDNANARSRI
jgi:hypothetical protein